MLKKRNAYLNSSILGLLSEEEEILGFEVFEG